jgi:Reverse transcriptase (RNA-dependent DNA polymerase)
MRVERDPVSSLIFVLVTDVLQRIIQHSRIELLTLPMVQNTALQFTDDTLIISAAHPNTLKTITKILRVYAQTTGLTINFQKKSSYL